MITKRAFLYPRNLKNECSIASALSLQRAPSSMCLAYGLLRRCWLGIVIFLFVCTSDSLFSDILKREGGGYLEQVDGLLILHVQGTPYQRGFQHGKLLKNAIQRNIATYIDVARPEQSERISEFQSKSAQLISYVPQDCLEELKGIAEGASVPFKKILSLNLFPEMFHCSGITVSRDATQDGKLYHVRVLDYSIGKNLEETAVVIVEQPEDGHLFLNVSYAGFIGSVTGMNEQKIAVGEIGGKGYGNWDGVPMAFLIREILQKASTLEEAKAILSQSPRTCEYFYILSDGKTGESVAVYATESQIHFIKPGENYALLAPKNLPLHYGQDGENDKFFLSNYQMAISAFQVAVGDDSRSIALFFSSLPHCLVLTGFANPERYPFLMERLIAHYGRIGVKELKEAIKPPVTAASNLHNAIFNPSELEVWISHPGPNGEPASLQPYYFLSARDWIKK